MVSEVSDDSTQAFGVTMLGTSWLLGLILGPAVSGAISDPIGQYNLTIERELVLLCVCVCVCVCVCACVRACVRVCVCVC